MPLPAAPRARHAWIPVALLLVGGAFIAYLLWEVGPARVGATIRALSWRLLLVATIPYGLTTTLDTCAWRLALTGRAVPFAALWWARVAGEAVNLATPTASMGGEPVKAYLIRRWVPLAEGLASVVIDKTTIVAGQGVFLLLGLLVCAVLVPLPRTLWLVMGVLLALEALAVGGFIAVQLRGAAGRGGRLLERLGMRPGADGRELLGEVDRALARFYRERRGRLLAAVLLHAAAWTAGCIEVYLVLRFVGAPVGLETALAIEAFATAIKFATFVIPGSLGALEGGNVAIFAALGLGGATGLSVTLIRRLREAAWVGIGMLGPLVLSARTPALDVLSSERTPETRP